MSDEELGAFSFAVLALVGRGGASPHDIVRLMREGSILWTTSESHFYAEPKRLAKLGYLTSEKRPGSTRERTFYELTDKGRQALREWVPRPAARPRIQHEAAIKIAAADFAADDQAVLQSLTGLREHLESDYRSLQNMEERATELPQRTRYARLLNGLARRVLDAQREWLDEVERELGPREGPPSGPDLSHNSKTEL
jgi:PadR family transcriptional regulator, regulatory protein AphA